MSDLIKWFRYVDDVLIIFTAKSDLKFILCFLDCLYRNLKFTVECELNNTINFLGINITLTDSKFHTSTYEKPNNSGLYLLWSSFTAKDFKIGLFFCLIHRSFKICNNWKQFYAEITILMDVFKRLDYSVTTLDLIKAKYISKLFVKGDTCIGPKKCFYVKLPYIGSFQLKYNVK